MSSIRIYSPIGEELFSSEKVIEIEYKVDAELFTIQFVDITEEKRQEYIFKGRNLIIQEKRNVK